MRYHRLSALLACLSLLGCPRVPDSTTGRVEPLAAQVPSASASPAFSTAAAPPATRELGVRPVKEGSLILDARADGKMLLTWSVGEAAPIRSWDIEHGTQIDVTRLEKDEAPHYAQLSPDGRFAAISSSRVLVMRDLMAHAERRSEHTYIEHIAWSPDGSRFLVGSDFDNVTLLDPKTGRVVRARPAKSPNPAGVAASMDFAWNPDGTVAAIQQMGKPTELWDAKTGASRGSVVDESVRFSPDGTRMAISGLTGGLALADGHTGGSKKIVRAPPKAGAAPGLSAFAFSPDSTKLAWATDESAELWDIPTAKSVASLPRKDAPPIRQLFLARDGRLVVLAADDSATLWITAPSSTKPLGSCFDFDFDASQTHLSCTLTEKKVETRVVFDGASGARAASAEPLGRVVGKDVAFVVRDSALVRREGRLAIEFREVLVDGKLVPLIVTPDGYFQGDRAAARLVLQGLGADGKERQLTDEEIASHEVPSLLSDFYAGKGAREMAR